MEHQRYYMNQFIEYVEYNNPLLDVLQLQKDSKKNKPEVLKYIRETNINKVRDNLIKMARKGKRGRPYQPIKNYTREQLNEMRNNKLNEINDNNVADNLEIHV